MQNKFTKIVGGIFVLSIGYFSSSWAENVDKSKGPKNDLVSDTPQVYKQALNPLNFEINYMHRANRQMAFEPLSNGSVLRSGEHYKLLFEAPESAYVYIYQVDSAHKIVRLFPSDLFQGADPENSNPVKAGVKYFVPGEYQSFVLDNQVGKETIYFVVTQTPDDRLENQYQTMFVQQNKRSLEQRFMARQKWGDTMKSRGVAGIVEDSTTTSQNLDDLCDGCVYIVTFEHR